MENLSDKCRKITNKFFHNDCLIRYPYPVKSFKYNYSRHLDRSINLTNDRVSPQKNPRQEIRINRTGQESSSKNKVSRTKTYYQENLQETTPITSLR